MKKILALVLVLCMVIAVVPVVAETAEDETASGLEDMFAGILDGEGSLQEKAAGLLEKLSSLKESFTGSDNQFSTIISSLGEKLQGMIQPGEEAIGDLLTGLKDKLSGIGEVDLGSILSGIFGGESEGEGFDLSSLLGGLTGDGDGEGFDLGSLLGGLTGGDDGEGFDLGSLLGGLTGSSGEEMSEEDDEMDYETMMAEQSLRNEAETGEGVPNRKDAESVEEFYGTWTITKMVYYGEEFLGNADNEGAFVAESTYYTTVDGEKASYYVHSETAELIIRDGVLKVHTEDDYWETYILTEDGEMVNISDDFLVYYVRVEEYYPAAQEGAFTLSGCPFLICCRVL